MSDATDSPDGIPPEPAAPDDTNQPRFREKPARFWAALRNQYFGAPGEDEDGIMTGTSK
jgi:hypothetical protein